MKNWLKIVLISAVAVSLAFSLGMTKSSKSAKYPWLGVLTQTVDKEIAEAFDLGVDYGAVVNSVIDDSPADQAGLKDGDVIISFNGTKITHSDDLVDMIEDSNPSDKAHVVIMRDDRQMEFDIQLEGRPRDYRADNYFRWISPPDAPGVPDVPDVPDVRTFYFRSGGYMGVELIDLEDQLAGFFGVDHGALVKEVEEDSPADKAGIKAGDVIVEIDDEDVEDYDDVRDILRNKEEGDEVAVRIVRDKKDLSLAVTLDEQSMSAYGDAVIFESPDVNVHIPKMKGLYQSYYNDAMCEYLESDEFKKEMQELQEELRALQKDLKLLQHDYKDELNKSLEELRKELEEIRQNRD